MRNYLLGVASGLAIYHYILGGSNQELITEMRGWVKSVDDRLAEAEGSKMPKPENVPGTPTEPEVSYEARETREPRTPSETPPPSPPKAA
jgi:hypothetical protein